MKDDKYILNLISQGEHQQLDFKFEINNSAKIAKTLSAFSNTEGGRLLIGVKDNGKIRGIKSEEEVYMIESAALRYCNPVVSFEFRKWEIEGKNVLEVYIPPVKIKPVLAKDSDNKWLAYIRVGDQNILANYILLQVWNRENMQKGTFVSYSEKENALLNFLASRPASGLDILKANLGYSNRILREMLINLISIGVVKMDIDEKNTTFSSVQDL